ncbi:membrane-associated phosphatidylinositol transfer protein 3-like [Brienomyrus brachyistius]|uniref:membrane-associated phosphatidylinositol transfer protein 3-like n=1 Tax=Brienomyrus brachyistius TaxID=42636 RepID=UPI0020B41DC5|nr:membrane-associated phosphatidylinositol transfer protein 3-like [Brienomyrus brachyistius]
MARETKAATYKFSAPKWRLQNIAQESIDSSDDEFFDAREMVEGKSAILLGMSQWNSNDLVEQIETLGHQGRTRESPLQHSQSSVDGQEILERKCKACILILVVHGSHALDPGGGDAGAKAGDVATLAEGLDCMARAHLRAGAPQHVQVRLVPCPPVCTEAFSLISNLNPYSCEESCVSSSVDHLPLAALPLLAVAAPSYRDAVATLIARANRVYRSFLQSEDGRGFTGQVCLMGDCIGGVLCFDALCLRSGSPQGTHSDCSRNNSMESIKDTAGLLGGASPSLGSSKRLSKSNVDVSAPRRTLRRKQSDSYDGDPNGGRGGFFSSDPLQAEDGLVQDSHSSPGRLEFQVSSCFLLGCPLGLVLAMRRSVLPDGQVSHLRPACSQIYNIFYPSDPSASRLEPLLHPRFQRLPPFTVPHYQSDLLGNGISALLADAIQSNPAVFAEAQTTPPETPEQRAGLASNDNEALGHSAGQPDDTVDEISAVWWGSKRLDYALHCPDMLSAFPAAALPQLFHSSYWESTDLAFFLLQQVMWCDCLNSQEADGSDSTLFSSGPREKWLRRRTHVKLRNMTANHRVNDIIATEDGPQVLVGRFMYGPLDMVTLAGEKVDVYLVTQPPSGRWMHFDTEVTNSSGRVTYTIPQEKKLGVGVYPIRMVVKGDQTRAEACLTVLPRGMECVVFSIDGSFAASVSLMGSDPKVRPGAVDVVRHWQDLGYLILYITGRPDMQKQRVVSWLFQHNFPQGAVFFSEGLVHDPLRQKAIFLRNMVQECHIKIIAAYGSTKDISVYNMLGLSPAQIYIVGRPSKKHLSQCQFLSEGYASHLTSLRLRQRSRPKQSQPPGCTVLRESSLSLAAEPDFLRKRAHLRRTMSVQQASVQPCTPGAKPERAQSQPESVKDNGGGPGGVAGPWGRGRAVWPRGSVHREDTAP